MHSTSADANGTVTVSQPPLVNNSVNAETGAVESANITQTYQGREDIHSNTASKHTNDVMAIPMVPSTDFVPSINLP